MFLCLFSYHYFIFYIIVSVSHNCLPILFTLTEAKANNIELDLNQLDVIHFTAGMQPEGGGVVENMFRSNYFGLNAPQNFFYSF